MDLTILDLCIEKIYKDCKNKDFEDFEIRAIKYPDDMMAEITTEFFGEDPVKGMRFKYLFFIGAKDVFAPTDPRIELVEVSKVRCYNE